MKRNGNWHYFGFHKDIHVYENDTRLGDDLDADKLAETLKLTGADFFQTDSKGHPGITSWFSETPDATVGPLHQDILKVWRAATKKLGLPLHAHYSGVFEIAAGKKHPEWAVIGIDGKPVTQTGWGASGGTGSYMCPRSSYLDQLMIPQLIEMIDKYGIDGFWIDGEIWAVHPCYCEKCRAAFTQKTGLAAPSPDSELLPKEWQVIAPLTRHSPLPDDWSAAIPATLTVDGKSLVPQKVQAANGCLNLAPLLGGTAEGRTALVYIPFTVNHEHKITFGFGADWWFEAFLDGVKLGDTLATGNPTPAPTARDYEKTITVTAGIHLLAIRFISGSASSVLAVRTQSPLLWQKWMDFTFESFEEHVTRYCDAVHRHKPGIVIASNWLYTLNVPREPKAPVDWISGDLTFGVDSCRTEARFISTRGKPWDMMLWCFCFTRGGLMSPNWTPIMKPVEMLQQEAATVIAFGGNVQVCENPMDGFRTGGVVPWRMKRLNGLSRFLHRSRTLCRDAASIPQVAIFHSEHHFSAMRGRNGSLWSNLNLDYLNGAVFSLLECHYGVDILDEWALLPRMPEFPVIVVPEEENLSDEMVIALKQYVASGGKLLVSGAAAFNRYGADFFGAETEKVTAETAYCVAIPDGAVPVFSSHWRLLKPGKAKPLGTLGTTQFPDAYRLPYPDAVVNRAGKGKVAYIPCDIFREFNQNLEVREYIRKVMRALAGHLEIEVAGPLAVDVVLRRKAGKQIVHLINRSNGSPNQVKGAPVEDIPAAGPLTVTVRTERRPKKVELKFEPGRLNWNYAAGKLAVEVPSVHIHAAVVISEGK